MIIAENTLKYIREARKPLLSKEREIELATIINANESGDNREEAIHKLINHNLLLVVKLAFQYSKKTGVLLDDLIGAGNVGLSKAARRYDPSKFHTRFSTYATYWIIDEILSLININSSPVTIPSYILDYKRKHDHIIEDGPIDDKDLMKKLEVNAINLKRIKMASTTSVPLDKPINVDGSDKQKLLKDIMEDKNSVSPSGKAEENGEFEVLYSAINELDETSKNIVLARYLSNDEAQLKKLGKKFNLSAERVRQISKNALEKLRRKISEKRAND